MNHPTRVRLVEALDNLIHAIELINASLDKIKEARKRINSIFVIDQKGGNESELIIKLKED